jgi:hypothetical protein
MCADREGSGPERGFKSKGSGPERGLAGKGSGRERGFRRKPRHNPARNAAVPRAGNEPLNPRTTNPPNPPEGGSTDRWAIIEEHHVSDRGRRRRRPVRVDLDEIRRDFDIPSTKDLTAWRQIRGQLRRRVGEDTFAIWLAPVELIAIDRDQRLVLAAPAPTADWTRTRFSRLIAATASEVGRDVRFSNQAERHAFDACAPGDPIQTHPKEAAG